MRSRGPSLLSPALRLFIFTMILANVSGRMVTPLLPLYLQSLGASVARVGLFFTLGAIVPLAFQILGGWVSDSLGRLPAIAIGSLFGSVGFIAFALAPSWEWLLIGAIGDGLSTVFVAPSYGAFIAEQSTEDTRGRVYGITDALFIVVGVIGPPLGGYLAQSRGFKPMFVVAAALYLTATAIRLLMARHARRTESARRPGLTLGGLKINLLAMGGLVTAGGVVTWILISDGMRDLVWRLSEQLGPLYWRNQGGLSLAEIGWLPSLSSFTAMLLAGPAGWLSDKKGERVGIVGGFALIVAGLAVFLQGRAFTVFAAAEVLFGLGMALIGPAYNSLISKAVPENLRGTAFGLFWTSLGVISLPVPYVGALLWERLGPQVPFYVPMVAIALTLPILWVKLKPPAAQAGRKTERPEEASDSPGAKAAAG